MGYAMLRRHKAKVVKEEEKKTKKKPSTKKVEK